MFFITYDIDNIYFHLKKDSAFSIQVSQSRDFAPPAGRLKKCWHWAITKISVKKFLPQRPKQHDINSWKLNFFKNRLSSSIWAVLEILSQDLKKESEKFACKLFKLYFFYPICIFSYFPAFLSFIFKKMTSISYYFKVFGQKSAFKLESRFLTLPRPSRLSAN